MMAEMVGFDSKGGAAAPAKPAKQEPFAIGCCVCPSGSDRAPATCRSGPGDPSTHQQTSDVLGALQKAEIEKWWQIVRAAKIKAE